jgi:hypothetical protein
MAIQLPIVTRHQLGGHSPETSERTVSRGARRQFELRLTHPMEI